MTKRVNLERTGPAGGRVWIDGEDYGHRWEIQGSTLVLIFVDGWTKAYATQDELERDLSRRFRTVNLRIELR